MLKNKAGTLLPLESFARLIITITLVSFIIFSCAPKLYSAIVGSKAGGSYDDLVDLIQRAPYDEQKPHNLYLDEGNAIIMFTKDSEKIEFEGKQSKYLTLKSYFNRPSNCDKDKACLCLCNKKFITENIPELKCSGTPKCEHFDNIDFPKTMSEKELGITDFFENYNFKNGFFIKRVQLTEREKNIGFYPAKVPIVTYSPITIYIKKDKDTNIVHISTKAFESI